MKFTASFKSSNIIYLITCRRSGQQYVGKSGQPLYRRLNYHHFNISHRRSEESPVAEHFTGDGHSEADMVVTVIDQLYGRDPCLHKLWQSRWIRTLETSDPSGMNLRVALHFETCPITPMDPLDSIDAPLTSKLQIGASSEQDYRLKLMYFVSIN